MRPAAVQPDAAAGGVRKQPTTSTMSMRPTTRLMMRVRVLPTRSPVQCSMVNSAMTRDGDGARCIRRMGHSVPRKTAAVSAA